MRTVPPVLTLLLLVGWLSLNNSASFGQILLGTALAVTLMWVVSRLRPVHPRLRKLWTAVPLSFVVLVDIVRSNVSVARIILGLVRERAVRSGFVDIPLDLRDPHGLAVLSMIVTSTPGTVWVGIFGDGKVLRLHVLDLVDEEYWIRLIKDRYESRLMKVFE